MRRVRRICAATETSSAERTQRKKKTFERVHRTEGFLYGQAKEEEEEG